MDLHFKTYGNHPKKLLILHGLFGMTDNWHHIAGKLSEKYTVIVVDLRNHGNSPKNATMNYDVMASDVMELLWTLQLEKVYLLGHSMGGKVAMNFALQYPDKLQKLIVVDIAPKNYGRGHDDIFAALLPLDLSLYKTRSEIDQQLEKDLPDFYTRQFILKNLQRNEEGTYSWKMGLKNIYDNYDNISSGELPEGKQYNGDTMFLKGEKSKYIQEKDKEEIEKYFPKAIFETIENAGHWVHADNPNAVVQAINNFIDL